MIAEKGKIWQEIPLATVEEKLKYIDEQILECQTICQEKCAEMGLEKEMLGTVLKEAKAQLK